MTISDFVSQNNGKGLDFDGAYGNQCVDLVQYWSQALGGPVFSGNAKDLAGQTHDFYQWIDNTPEGVPAPGDIMVWDTRIGPYGHTAACVDANVNSFDSFDQNWNFHPYCEVVHHTYFGVAGWLHRDTPTNNGDETMNADQEKQAYQIVLGRDPEFQGSDGRSAFQFILDAQPELSADRAARQAQVDALQKQVNDASGQVAQLHDQVQQLQTQLSQAQAQLQQSQQTPVASDTVHDTSNATVSEVQVQSLVDKIWKGLVAFLTKKH